jgi:hypothetical protein
MENRGGKPGDFFAQLLTFRVREDIIDQRAEVCGFRNARKNSGHDMLMIISSRKKIKEDHKECLHLTS